MVTRLFILIAIVMIYGVCAHQLVKVVILSRHNVRAPLVFNLEKVTPNIWPKWSDVPGFMTAKGILLESYMGEYFSQWLENNDLFYGCPKEDTVLIYANAPQRTRETARVFVETAFKDCNLTVQYKENVIMDPVFNPIIINNSEIFKQKVVEEMQKKLDELKLDDVYLKLNKILDFKNSRICKETEFCDLTKKKDDILFKVGEEPNIYGPLSIGSSVLDAFLMAFYNGTRLEEIGWGGINSEDWELLTKVTKENQNVRFNGTFLAPHVARPLLRKMNKIISNDDIKFSLFVGHDSNINPLITSLRFRHFELPNQYERTPVGGKIVFQKWYDAKRKRFLLKVDYVYQTTDQLRNGTRLSLKSPPNSVRMELTNCKADENGFCDWADFLKIIGKFK